MSLNGGTGAIAFDSNVAAQDVYWQANGYGDLIVNIRNDATDSITIHNDLTNNAWGVSSGITQLKFSDGTVLDLGQPAAGQGSPLSFTWIGTSNASISGSGFGSNTFELGAGSESFTGGTKSNGGNGNNTYLASANTGQATINPNEASGTTNELDFTGGITDENLWFIQSGNNLKIDLLGTSTSVTVNGWFSSSSNQLQEITAGGLKIDSQISQLVQAMATYSANNSGFDPTARPVSTLSQMTAAFNAMLGDMRYRGCARGHAAAQRLRGWMAGHAQRAALVRDPCASARVRPYCASSRAGCGNGLKKVRPRIAPRPDLTGARGTSAHAAISFYIVTTAAAVLYDAHSGLAVVND